MVPVNGERQTDILFFKRGESTMDPMVNSAYGRIFKALLEAFPVLSEVMQQTGKVCFICQPEGSSELSGPFCHVSQMLR